MHKIPWHKIFIDIVILATLCGVFLMLKFLIETSIRGFFCDDFSVNMPFKSSTVNNIMLFLISFVFPIVFIVASELGRGFYAVLKRGSVSAASLGNPNKYTIQLPNRREVEVKESIGNILINLMYFCLGHLCNSIVTLLGKKTIGRLRPNFLDVCKPESNPYNTLCNTIITGKTYLVPEVDFKCLTSIHSPKEVEESRKSFPSGHASSMFFGMIFLCIYVHRVWSKPSLGFIPHILQLVFLATAVFVSLTRVIDNKHHPTDVLAGSALGIAIAFATGHYLNIFYRRFNYKAKYDLALSSLDYQMSQGGGRTAATDSDASDPESAVNKSANTNTAM